MRMHKAKASRMLFNGLTISQKRTTPSYANGQCLDKRYALLLIHKRLYTSTKTIANRIYASTAKWDIRCLEANN